MFFAWRVLSVTVIFLSAIGCGGAGDTPRAASTGDQPAATSTSAGSGVQVVGKIAPTVAPPSALMVLEAASDVELPIKAETAVIDQAGYEFLPGFLVAQAGQIVQFRNSEDVLHNVRVTNTGDQQPVFNIATAPFGKYEHTFEPGYYAVTCDIHTAMRSSILVTRTPYTATTETDGSFAIENVKPGPYKLTIYAGAQPVVRPIEVKNGRTDLGLLQ
jgi:plastocyanin